MQEVLSPFHARGSVSGVDPMQGVLCPFYARGSVSEVGQQDQKKCSSCKGFCLMQEYLSCKWSCLWSGSHARGSTHLMQGVLSPEQQ